MTSICIYIYAFTTYDYASISCLLINIRQDVSYGGYQSFYFMWYLNYSFYQLFMILCFALHTSTFYPRERPIAWRRCVFVSCMQVQIRILINLSTRIYDSAISCCTSFWSFHRIFTFFVQFRYSRGLVSISAYDIHRGYYGHSILDFFLSLSISSHISQACINICVCVYVLNYCLVDQLVFYFIFFGLSTFVYISCYLGYDSNSPDLIFQILRYLTLQAHS